MRSTTAWCTRGTANQLRLADVAKRGGSQQLFQVLRDDGLAAGLAAGADGAAPRGGLPDRQLHHLPAGLVADRRGVRVHPEATAEADGNLASYAINRSLLLDGLRRIGIDRLAPTDGAFYVYADVSDFTSDSLAFCSKLLADTGVAIAPGIDFDTARGFVCSDIVCRAKRRHRRSLTAHRLLAAEPIARRCASRARRARRYLPR